MSTAQILSRIILLIATFAVVLTSARSTHFGEGNQENVEGETINAYPQNILSSKDLDLLNRLELLTNLAPQYPNPWENNYIRANEVKRNNNRMRCYFNPVSCYKK